MNKRTRSTGKRSPVTPSKPPEPSESVARCARCGRTVGKNPSISAGKPICIPCQEQVGDNG